MTSLKAQYDLYASQSPKEHFWLGVTWALQK